jgi:peptidoglycan/LPS O-acetylase OafA/YrhL
MTRIFFPNLDGMRFVAFFMVFLWHAFEEAFRRLAIENVYLSNIFYTYANGKTGVSVFFVLSGFLITFLILKEIEAQGRIDIKKFYVRRTLRIWPIYYLVLLIVFLVIPFIIQLAGLDWTKYQMNPVYYFVFLSNFDVLRIFQTGGLDFLPSTVTWSVAIEEQFYLVWPLLFLLLKPSWYKFIFPVVIVLTLSVCGDLGLGGYAAWLSINNEKFRAYFTNQTNLMRWLSYLAGLFAMYTVQLYSKDVLAWGRMLQTIFFAYVIIDQNFSSSRDLKFSNNKFMSWWGKYTYGLYLYHPLVLVLLTTVISKFLHIDITSPLNLALIGLAAFPICLLVSYLSYEYIEKRFLKMKLRYAYISKD